MAKPEFVVQPQRSDGRAWVPCEMHRAQAFAVVRVDKVKKHGKLYKVSRVIERCKTIKEAEALAEANRRSFTPMPRHLVRKLGVRIVKEKC